MYLHKNTLTAMNSTGPSHIAPFYANLDSCFSFETGNQITVSVNSLMRLVQCLLIHHFSTYSGTADG
jgi:hypothetical protein